MRRLLFVLAVTALVAAGWPTTQALAQDSSKTRGTVSALSGGIQLGMVFAAVIGVAVLVLAFFVPGRESAGQGNGPSEEDEQRDARLDEEVVA